MTDPIKLADELERLRIMTTQKLRAEMDDPEDGDYETAYDWFVYEARAIYPTITGAIRREAALREGLTFGQQILIVLGHFRDEMPPEAVREFQEIAAALAADGGA